MGGYGGNEKMVFKKKLLVELELDSGAIMNGYLFVGQTQRLSDLMNDDRTFLPFEDMDGDITIFTKALARRVKPVEKAQIGASDSTDPYALLGIAQDASEIQVRDAFHRKVQETHPDKLANLGLSADIIKFAHDRMARINEAYNKIRM